MTNQKPVVFTAGHPHSHGSSRARNFRYGNFNRFDRDRLPSPLGYYSKEFPGRSGLTGYGEWRSAVCPFHDDHSPSLRVNVLTGAFKCFPCDVTGGDIIDFQRLRYGQSFREAAKALGAWRNPS